MVLAADQFPDRDEQEPEAQLDYFLVTHDLGSPHTGKRFYGQFIPTRCK